MIINDISLVNKMAIAMSETCTQRRSFSCDGPRNAISIVITINDERRQINLETFSTTVEEIFLSCFLEFPCAV